MGYHAQRIAGSAPRPPLLPLGSESGQRRHRHESRIGQIQRDASGRGEDVERRAYLVRVRVGRSGLASLVRVGVPNPNPNPDPNPSQAHPDPEDE